MWFTGVYIAANAIMSLFLEKQLQQEESVHPRIVLDCELSIFCSFCP